MGRGIAQVSAQAGCEVYLLDAQESALTHAVQQLHTQWSKLQAKGRVTAAQFGAWTANVHVTTELGGLAGCDLVIEAIVEDLAVKRKLMQDLDALLPATAVLASNTSSLSITSIGAGLAGASRLAGFHFFNPVPLMKVVEVVPGLNTHPDVVQRLCEFARAMGHTPVTAQDTPGFIVNHAGRGFVTEALQLVGERVADFSTTDAILKDQAGFKLGPFELMDLTGLDVSHPVMVAVHQQYFGEPRYKPSVITAQRLAGGVLGRKTGRGFYAYADGAAPDRVEPQVPLPQVLPPVWVSPKAARRAELYQLLKNLGARIETGASPSEQALILVAPLGLDISTLAAVERLDATRTLGIDLMLPDTATRRRVLATNPATRPDMRDAAWAIFAGDGKPVSVVRDSGGFVTQRVLAHIVNIAADMCQQGICTPSDLDTAVTLGLGYPHGPLAWGDLIGPTNVLEVLFNLQTVYGDARYRPSPWLRRRGALGLSLTQTEL